MTKQRIGIAFRKSVKMLGNLSNAKTWVKKKVDGENVRRYAAFVLLAVVLTSTGAAAAVRQLSPEPVAVTQPQAAEPAEPVSPGTQAAPGGSAGQESKVKLTPDDIYLLACLINGEARGEPFEGQVAVGAVVLNRVASGRFPNTVGGVVYQPGQFEVVANGQINLTPTESSLEAAKAAAAGWDPTGGALYFFDPSRTWNSFLWSRPLKVIIGGHWFTS